MRSPRRSARHSAPRPDTRRRLTIASLAVASVGTLVGAGPIASAVGGAFSGASDSPATSEAALRAVSLDESTASGPTSSAPSVAVVPPAPRAATPAVAASTTTTTTAPTSTTTTTETSSSSSSSSSSSGSSGLSSPLAAVVKLTNIERAAAGCRALSVDSRLMDAAMGHSRDQASMGSMSHTGSDGSSFVDRITAEGYSSPGAENVAAGQGSASEVVQDWMNSPGHRKNILNCSLTTIGVGVAGSGNYWTQDFGR